MCVGPNWECFLLNWNFPLYLYIVLDFFIHELWTGVDCKCQRYLHMISSTRKGYSFVIFYRDVCCFGLFKADRICLFIPVVGQKILWECCQRITTYATILYYIQAHIFELGGFSFLQFFLKCTSFPSPFQPVHPPSFSGFLCSLLCLLPVNVLKNFWCHFFLWLPWKTDDHFYC